MQVRKRVLFRLLRCLVRLRHEHMALLQQVDHQPANSELHDQADGEAREERQEAALRQLHRQGQDACA